MSYVAAALMLVAASGHAATAKDHPRHKKVVHARAAKKTGGAKPVFASAHYKIEQIIAPSAFHGIQGLALGPDGILYAASLLGRTISKVDVATGATTPYLGPLRGGAGDMAFGPDGSLAWAAVKDAAVLMRTSEHATKTVARDMPGVRGVGFGKDGHLYFSRSGDEDGLYEVNPSDAESPRLVTANVGGLGPFQIDDKGTLYGSALFRRELVKIDLASGEMTKIVDGFKSPGAVRLGRDGAPIVLERSTGELIRVDVETGDENVIAKLDPPSDTFAIARDGTIFAATAAFNGITAIDPKTHAVRRVTWSNLGAPGMLALNATENGEELIAADAWGTRRIDPATGETKLIGTSVDTANATSVAVRGDALILGNIWPVGSIQIVARDDGKLRANLTNFGIPYGIVPLRDGFVVADYTVGRLTKVADDVDHTRTTLAWGFDGPVGLADAGNGMFYVSEYDAGKITRVDTANNDRSTVIAGLMGPEGIAVAPDGRLIVAEVGARRVLAVNVSTGTAEALAEGLAIGLEGGGSGPNLPTGVAATKDGVIYVTGDIDNVLYRLTPPAAPSAKDTPPKDTPPKDGPPK